MKVKLILAMSASALVAACVGSSESVQVGSTSTTAGGVEFTPSVIYNNGAVIADWQQDGFSGVTFASSSAIALNDPGSTRGATSTDGDLSTIVITAVSETADINQAGVRYLLSTSDGFAASQFRSNESRGVENLGSFGTAVTTMPTGNITYGSGVNDTAFINIDGQTVQLPFVFSADLGAGTATMTANNGAHSIDGGAITIDPSTGRFSGTEASIGAVGSLQSANIYGGLYGTTGNGVGGVVFTTDQANPSITANFVGSR